LIQNLSKEDEFETENKEEESEDEAEEMDGIDQGNKPIRFFEIEILQESSLDFDFIFHPEELVGEKDYETVTAFELKGVENGTEGLQRKVFAKVVKSKITFNTTKVVFPKTFIFGNEKNFSTYSEIKMSNDTLDNISWELNTKEIDKDKIFSIAIKDGILTSENYICTLKFTFTPQEKKKYSNKVTLWIYDPEVQKKVPYKELTLEGEGSHPRLYFDKREIILPIVPLGFESKMKFKVFNEGYDNTKITHKIFPEHLEKDKTMKLTYCDGNNIGILKPDLKMEISFMSLKPISRTCKLTFYDENNKESSIMIATTADNCLFTNFSFLQKNIENAEIYEDVDTGAVNLRQVKDEADEMEKAEDDDNKSRADSHVSSAVTKGSSGGGYNRVNQIILQENCKYIKKFLKMMCPNMNSTLKNFPEDLYKDNAEIIYELIYTLTGKPFPQKLIKVDDDFNKSVIQIKNQYDTLIRFLQGEGAFLNNIFPEYLMDFQKYKKFLENDPMTPILLASNWAKNKRLRSMHKYICTDSWIVIFYQILKIYYLNRVNITNFKKAIKHLREEEQNTILNGFKIIPSNVYSTQEQLLLKWLQVNYEHAFPTGSKKIINFSEDISDGAALTGLVLSYFPKADEEFKIKKKSNNENKFIIPANKILEILNGYGVVTHMREKYIIAPSAREIILFIAMLYQNLQLFVPRETVLFQCILGDTVQNYIKLKNDSKKRISYYVKKEGDDFTINNLQLMSNQNNLGLAMPYLAEVRLEIDDEKEFPVTFKSRITAPQEGKIYFLAKNEGNGIQAAPIIFNLLSKIIGRRSQGETQFCQSYLYKPYVKKLMVKCPFPLKDRQEFTVTLEIKKKAPVDKKNKRTTSLVKQNLKPLAKTDEVIYRVFYTRHDDEGQKFTIKLDSESNLLNT